MNRASAAAPLRVLVTGAHGQLGRELLRHAPADWAVVGLGAAQLDIRDAAQVAAQVERVRPQLIVNAAAYTAVDRAETEPARAWAVNRDGAAHLAQAAQQRGIALFQLSSDYVFAGDLRRPYREEDACRPLGVYGASKLGGEQAVRAGCSRHLILRSSWVFGAHGHNFVKTMLRLAGTHPELAVVADQMGCPTPAAYLAQVLWQLAQRYRQQGDLAWGTYHCAGAPPCSWHAFALEIFRQAEALALLARTPQVRAIGSTDYPGAAQRPAYSVLDCGKLRATFGIAPADWRTALAGVLGELAAG